jgi:hypothetical protein
MAFEAFNVLPPSHPLISWIQTKDRHARVTKSYQGCRFRVSRLLLRASSTPVDRLEEI